MDNLPEQLRKRVWRLNCDVALDVLRSEDAVCLACDLVVARVATPATIELAGESQNRLVMSDALPIVRQMLAELRVEPVTRLQAPWLLVQDVAQQVVSGRVDPLTGAHTMLGLSDSCGYASEIEDLWLPIDAWDMRSPEDRDDLNLRSQLKLQATHVIRRAETELAALLAGPADT